MNIMKRFLCIATTMIFTACICECGVQTLNNGAFNAAAETYPNVYGHGYFDMDCYVAGLMTDETNPICKTINYKLSNDTPSDVLVKAINSDNSFLATMAAWEVLTFAPSDITETTINEIGYYETMIFKSLKTSFETDVVKNMLDTERNKTSIKLFSIFKNVMKLDYAIDNLDGLDFRDRKSVV